MRTSRLQHRYLARRLDILRAAGREFRHPRLRRTVCAKSPPPADLSPCQFSTTISAAKTKSSSSGQDKRPRSPDRQLDRTRRARTSATEKLRTVIAFHLHCVLDEVEGSAAHLLTNSISAHLQSLLAKRDRYEQGRAPSHRCRNRSSEFARHDPPPLAGPLNPGRFELHHRLVQPPKGR